MNIATRIRYDSVEVAESCMGRMHGTNEEKYRG